MKSKTIILSSENNSGRGILTISFDDDLLKCKIRLYNLSPLNIECKIGIFHQNKTYSSNLLKRSDCYESSLVGDFDMDKDFYCALVDTADNNKVILSGGTYAGYYFNNNSVFDNLDSSHDFDDYTSFDKHNDLNTLNSYEDIYKSNKNCFDFDEKTDDIKNCNLDCESDKCKNCKYKEFFYASENKLSNTQNSQSLKVEKETSSATSSGDRESSLLTSIIPQFDYIFENYSANTELNNLISNGKFVKIEEGTNSYSLGAIYEHGEIKYICYATKKDYNDEPPKELGKNYQWLPLDAEDPLSEGYYIVYQDAKDLKILQM